MEKDNSNLNNESPQTRSLGSRIFRSTLWLLLFVIVSIGLLLLALRTESVQNYLGNFFTQKLSKNLDSTIDFKHIKFEVFDNLVLDSFFVEDQNGDTLLFSEKLIININSGLFSLLNNQLDISDVTLQNAQLNLNRRPGEKENNLNQILGKLFPPKKKNSSNKEKSPFYLDADFIYLDNVYFEKDDAVSGERLSIFVKKGKLQVENIDLVENVIAVNIAEFEESNVAIKKYEKTPLPIEIDTTQLVEVDAPENVSDSLKKPFRVLVHDFDFGDGTFSLHDFRKSPIKSTPPEELDWDHLDVYNINIAIDSFEMFELNFYGNLKQLSAMDSSGFVLENLSAPDVKVMGRRTELNGVNLKTPYSNVKDTIIFKYREFSSFKDFEDKVSMDLKFDNSYVAIKDVITFAPKLKSNKFFANNAEEVIRLDGGVKGRINNLRGEDLKLLIGRNTVIEGDFNSRDLAEKGNESLNLGLKKLKTNVSTIRQLIPNFNPPANFDKLGNINFDGRFDGFFVDFVAYGNLKTDLGSAQVDMRLDLKEGKTGAKYSGNLNLLEFDLATWSGNSNLGTITVTSEITNGVGLTGATANAKIDANVDQFIFKGYNYQDFKMDGKLNQNLFDGKFEIADKNIDLAFDGSLDFTDSIPELDFKAKINTLNLDDLNITKQDLGISGEMDLKIRDLNISNLTGDANFRNLVLKKDGVETYEIDTLSFYSIFGNQGQRIFSAESEIFEGKIRGDYDIQEVPEAFVIFVEKNYPEISEKLGIKSKRQILESTNFEFDVKIINSKNFTNLIDPKLDTIKNFLVRGNYDGEQYQVNLELDIEELTYDNIEVGGIRWNSSALRSLGQVSSLVPFYSIIGKNYIPEISIDGQLDRDTIVFEIGFNGEKKTFDRFNIGGKIFFTDGGFNISLANDSLLLFGEEWEINEKNFIQLKKRILDTEGFVLKNRDRIVSINDIDKKGIQLHLENFNTGFIDSIWNYSKMDFAGNYSLDVKANDIYDLKNFEAKIQSDTFWVNGDDWGAFELNATMADLKSQLFANLSIQRGLRELILDGFYILPSTKKAVTGERNKLLTQQNYPSNYFDFDLSLLNYPLNIADYFIGDHVSDTEGLVDLEVDLFGFPKKIESAGSAKIYKGGITVDYLNTRYSFGTDEPTDVKITNNLFDFSNNSMTDKYGNTAFVTGGITHTHLRYLGLNARIFSDRLLVLDTDKYNNPVYYGHGIGQVDAKFTGLMQYVNVEIDATTGKGSEVFIPVQTEQNTSEISFIKFRDKNKKKDDNSVAKEVRGMEVDMNVNMTEDAQVSLIFDERAGDIMRGRGTGPLQMRVPRSGDITLFGEYLIGEGDYLFTLQNIVNKKFKVERGGTINWTGDPFGAIINVEANYDRLTTPVSNFIQEFIELSDDELKSQARISTSVDLEMKLTGDLLKPDINFDISFPDLALGNVRNYVETKLRILRQDQNEMNRQVFGLIVIGGFLPSGDQAFAGGEIATSTINTVSEYFSHRLSSYLTQLLSEALKDVGFISGIDFDIGYSVYDGSELNFEGGTELQVLSGTEMEVNLNSRFNNDRWSLNGGILRSTQNQSIDRQGTFVGGDLVIEYFLTDDRRFKVRFYQRYDQDVYGNRSRTGIGVNYRRQFNTFSEFIKGMKKSAKKLAPEEPSN